MFDDRDDTGRAVAISVTVVAAIAVTLMMFSNPAAGPETATEASAKKSPAGETTPSPKFDAAGFSSETRPVHDPTKPLLLTIPRLENLDNSEVVTAPGDDKAAFKNHAGVHIQGTGYPWQEGANVYIAGHRMGFPGTPSDRTFYHLEDLRNGDKVILSEPNGNSYLYQVYETVEVGPEAVEETLPVAGKSIVSLQTCTLPDYTRRVIVRAEKEA